MYTDEIKSFVHKKKEFSIWKMVETAPRKISYGVFNDEDKLEFRCELSFFGCTEYKDDNYYLLYTDVDDVIADCLEMQFCRNYDNVQSGEELERIRRQIRLNKFDAAQERKKKK